MKAKKTHIKRIVFSVVTILFFISALAHTVDVYLMTHHKKSFTLLNQKKIPVLIVDGFSNHDWKQTTIIIQWLLAKSGRFNVDVSTVPTDSIQLANWKPDFSK